MLYNLFENRDFVSVFAVALLSEGVDRNRIALGKSGSHHVALLAEGVDRNNNIRKILAMLDKIYHAVEGNKPEEETEE